MGILSRNAAFFLVSWLLLAGCAPRVSDGAPAQQTSAVTGPKRLVAAIQGKPVSGYARLNVNGSERGNAEIAATLHRGLTTTGPTGQMHPELVEAVPTVDNGLWRVLPDGRMETTWRIRAGAEWHDGTPLTTDDLLFTYWAVSDRDLPILRDRNYDLIEAVDLVDAQTVTVHWREPFIRADTMFSDSLATPLPRHLLEASYKQDKASFFQLPYWTAEFVGLGPYRLKEWDPGSRVVVQANDGYLLGRPRIDEIEFRTIPDTNAIMANLLAGSVDIVLDRAFSLDHIVQLRERMPDAQLQTPLTSLLEVNPQMLNPNPAVVADLRFRRAMIHAINRQELADTIDYGLVPVAHGTVYPTLAVGRATESAAVRYEYDPRLSAQMIEGLGYRKAADGFYRDPGGQELRLEIRTTAGDINPKTLYAVADFLQRAGIAMDPVIIPLQLVTDQEYRANFPGLIVNGGGGSDRELEASHSKDARLPENNYRGSNRSRYMNPELDAFIDRYVTTIPFDARMEHARGIARHVSENLPTLPLFFDSWPGAAAGRLVNVGAAEGGARAAWNVREWDIR